MESLGVLKATISFHTEERDGETVHVVRDDGIGFDMRYASELFAPLRQLNPPGAFEGSGLGLVVVRHAVERMGGSVGARGEPERGAEFWFTLGDAS
jgi:signal transduction histidine kinase